MRNKQKNQSLSLITSKYARSLFKKYKVFYILGIICLVVIDYLQTLIPIYTGAIVDGIENASVNLTSIWEYLDLIIYCAIVIIIGRVAWRHFIFGSARRIERDVRNDIFEHLEKLSSNFYSQHNTGELMSYITNDLEAIRQAMGRSILMVIDVVSLVVFTVYKMVTEIDFKLTLIAIVPLGLIAVITSFLGPRVFKRFTNRQASFSKMSDFVQEDLSGINVVKSFVQEKNKIADFKKVNKHYYDSNISLFKLSVAMDPLMKAVAGLAIAISIIYGGIIVLDEVITIGDFTAFIEYLGMLVWPMKAVGMAINTISMGSAALERVEKILSEPIEISEKLVDSNIKSYQGSIKFNNLSFKYHNTNHLFLKNINLEINNGETLGIVGRTGSGKTTLVNLLLRMYNVPQNTIIIGGYDISQIPLAVLRRNIGYVPQDDFLFSETIEDNVKFNSENISHAQVVKACELACVDDNIRNFSEGYETVVGERGVTLSGGQKQRIAIARAIIKNPEILILDDSISAVDTDTQERILHNLKTFRKNKTTIIIAHRISTLMHADNIIVIDKGEIIERGKHQDLLAMQGLYSSLYQKQLLADEIAKEV